MDCEKLKASIGGNISRFRRQCGLTQAELAQRLNYTDKAVSKWERGESVPDVVTLVQLAEVFGITLDTLVSGDAQVPAVEVTAAQTSQEKKKPAANRTVIFTLSSLLVWFVALTVYVVLSSVNIGKSWVAFVYAVPVNAIVLLSVRSAFRRFRWNHALVSMIMWGVLASIYVTLLVFVHANVWRLVLIGLLGQVAVSLWFCLFHTPRGKDNG